MEIDDNNENKDITASQLYEKFESWNKEMTNSFKEGKKGKKGFSKLKDFLVKFNKWPTPIKGLELIDIKLGTKIKEDEIFLEKDFIAQHLRRGEALFYNKEENNYDYARIGLPKFFDYKKAYQDTESDQKLKERVLGKILEESKNGKNDENLKFFAYLTTKVNGENCQVSYNTKYDCWIIGSKNVSVAIRNKEDIEFYKNTNNFKDYLNKNNGSDELLSEKEKKKKENREKKQEKKKKKQERLERRKKGKKEDNEENDEKEEDEKEEKEKNQIIEENKNEKNNKEPNILDRFTFALDFAETWLKILEEKIINNINKDLINQLRNELGNHTLIGESVGDKKREHILVYKERDIIFYGIVNNQKLLSENCLPLSKSFDIFKKYNLSYTQITPSPKFNTLEELLIYINDQYDVIFDKSLQESGEGNVVYFSCDKTSNESVQGLAKLKTFDYRYYRKVREKLRAIPPKVDRAVIEKEISKKFNDIKKKKDKKKKGKSEKEDDKEEIIKLNRKIDNEVKDKNDERNKRISSLIKKIKNESYDLLKEVPKSKFNLDKNLLNEYFDFGEYLINYRAIDDTNYFDVFASFIEIMKEKFKVKAEINDLLVNEIRKKFEGLISNTNEENEEDGKEEDPKE